MDNNQILERFGISVEDADKIVGMCEDKCITVKQLIHQFLCDLSDNDQSSGSDERILVSEWFFRCQFY